MTTRITIGNASSPVKDSDKSYDWTMYVRGSNDFVDKVVFELHPTFSPPSVTVSSPPFEITRRGWGTFDVKVKVFTKDGRSHVYVHALNFSNDGKDSATTYDVKNIAAPSPPATVAAAAAKDSYAKDPQIDALVGQMKAAARIGWMGTRMTGVSVAGMHGHLGNKDWAAPRRITFCDEEARPGYNTKKAHEYSEEPSVLEAKVKLLAKIIRKSKFCTAYTGAGISTASGIDDYASKAKGSVAMKRKKVSGFDAMPTLAHRVLGALHRAGHLKHWVQQNHDGLPQKAGFPPEHLNEIHGAWYDPSNPVVPMSGSLRGDLLDWLAEWERCTDLCLAMGTSLCGMNADRMVETPSRKFAKNKGFGAVIVSLQRTQYDEVSSLRIYAKIDEVMAMLAKEMNLHVRAQAPYAPVLDRKNIVRPDVYRVPYDASGKLTKDASKWQEWDLRTGSEVRVTAGPGKGYVGVVIGKRKKDGHFRIKLPLQREGHPAQGKQWSVYILGSWWLETATNGKFHLLPVVNTGRKPRLGWDKSPPTQYHIGKA
eukprot:g1435.t1